MKKSTFLIAGLALLFSCSRDKIDLDMLEDITFNPELEAPIIKAKLSLADLAAKDSNFIVDGSNRLSVKYVKDSIFSFRAIDFVEIPQQDPFEVGFIPFSAPFDFGMALGTMGGVQLALTEFEKGYIEYTLEAPDKFLTDVEVEVTIKNGNIHGAPMSKVITLPANTPSITDTLNIASSEMDFSDGGTNYIGLKVDVLNKAAITEPFQTIELKIQFRSLALEKTFGNFGQRQINIPNSQFDFDVSGIEKFTDGLYLLNPRIKLISTSTVGVDLGIDVDFDGVNEAGQLSSLDAPSQEIKGPALIGAQKVDSLTFDKANSKIVDFIAAVPTKVLYGGKAILNPQGAAGGNFLDKNSKVEMGVEIDLPLELQADNFLLEQMLEGVKLSSGDGAEIEEANLIFYTKNGFPFEVNLSVSILGTENDSIDGLILKLMEAPPVDGQGRVISRSEGKETVRISKSTIENINRTGKIRLRARVSTPNNGQQSVVMFTDYNLEVKIAAQFKANLKP